MATAKEALQRALAESVVPLLRSDGFKGSNPTWVRTSDRGDAAVVNVQLSPWNTSNQVSFYVNLAVVPEPWRAWTAAQVSEPVPSTVKEYDGLWRARLAPTPRAGGSPGAWDVCDERTAQAAARDVAQRLDDAGLPALGRSLDRAVMLDALRPSAPGAMPRAGWETHQGVALVVLLADSGPSQVLDAALASVLARAHDVEDWDGQLALLQRWVEERATGRAGGPG